MDIGSDFALRGRQLGIAQGASGCPLEQQSDEAREEGHIVRR